MERLLRRVNEGRYRWLIRGLLGAAAIGIALIVRANISDTEFRIVHAPQRVQLTDELPEPEHEELPEFEEPEPEETVDLESMDEIEELDGDDMPPVGDMLGLDGDGVAGGDAFGLIARKGGRDLLKTGSGIGCEWYASVLNSELNELLLPVLNDNDKLLRDDWSVLVKLWLEPDGAVQRFEVSSTGQRELDAEINGALARFDRVATPPPAGMPQPVRLRLRCNA